jgi:hypothetical protein
MLEQRRRVGVENFVHVMTPLCDVRGRQRLPPPPDITPPSCSGRQGP